MIIELNRDDRACTQRNALAGLLGTSRVLTALLAALSLFSMQGCGDRDEPRGLTKQAIAISDVPEGLRKKAQKEVPEVELTEAWKNLDGTLKLHSYEIRGRRAADGKIREVRISTDGQILEKE
jgi:hypothetical protein